jgi:hypothetical protein
MDFDDPPTMEEARDMAANSDSYMRIVALYLDKPLTPELLCRMLDEIGYAAGSTVFGILLRNKSREFDDQVMNSAKVRLLSAFDHVVDVYQKDRRRFEDIYDLYVQHKKKEGADAATEE